MIPFSCVDYEVFPNMTVSFTLWVDCGFSSMIVQSMLVCLCTMWLHPYPAWLYVLCQHDCTGYDCDFWLRSMGQYASALTLSCSLSRYTNWFPRLTCPFSDKIKSEISEYMVDSNIGYDSLLLISTVHYFILLLLYMEFDDSQGPTLMQWQMER